MTEAALAFPTAEAANAHLVLIIFQGNSCIHQSQTHSTVCSVVGWVGLGEGMVPRSALRELSRWLGGVGRRWCVMGLI